MFPPGDSEHASTPVPTLPGLRGLVSSLDITGHDSDLGHGSLFKKPMSTTQMASVFPAKRDLTPALWGKC